MLEFSFSHSYFFSHILTNIKLIHITSTHYHYSIYLVFEFTFNVTYFHVVIDV